MNADENAIRLREFEVKGLFGELNHKIPINIDARVTAILAPNGMGKTICLRMIDSLFRRQWSFFASVEFSSAVYEFSDGSRIRIVRSAATTDAVKNFEPKSPLTIEISTGGKRKKSNITWKPKPASNIGGSRVEAYLSFLTRIAPDRWLHDHTGQTFSISEVIENFGDQLPDKIIKLAYQDEPEELKLLIEAIECHLIETQRLLVLGDGESDRYRNSARRALSSLAISKKAKSLSEIIAQDLQKYATLSQSLDSTFPQRVIESQNPSEPDSVKKAIDDLELKREKLTEAGILDKETTGPFNLPQGKIDAATLRVLSIYTEDTKRKLGSLQQLLDRIQLFKTLVGSRFTNKTITVDRKAGIKVASKKGEVPLEKLSSGEQHQLVLFFELLFELGKNALILIDEPELSLHVAWQARFVEDLIAIIELNGFDVILATHSPQLIGLYDSLIVELGEVV
jgi:predicted ATP-binding protein involved in virulence